MSWFKLKAAASQEGGQFLELTTSLPQTETEIVFANGIRLIYRGPLSTDLIQLLRDA